MTTTTIERTSWAIYRTNGRWTYYEVKVGMGAFPSEEQAVEWIRKRQREELEDARSSLKMARTRVREKLAALAAPVRTS